MWSNSRCCGQICGQIRQRFGGTIICPEGIKQYKPNVITTEKICLRNIYVYIYTHTITRNYCSLGFFSTLIKHNKDKRKKYLQKKNQLNELENKKPIRCTEVIMKLTKIKEKKTQPRIHWSV